VVMMERGTVVRAGATSEVLAMAGDTSPGVI
jgi:hypothetical protein